MSQFVSSALLTLLLLSSLSFGKDDGPVLKKKPGTTVINEDKGEFSDKPGTGETVRKLTNYLASKKPRSGKLTVVNLCYHQGGAANHGACKEIERRLKSEECAKHVDFVDVDDNLSAERLHQDLRARKLPPGTLVFVGGHMAGAGRKLNAGKDDFAETLDEWRTRVKEGRELALVGMTPRRARMTVGTEELKDAITEAIVNPAIWVSSCHAGGMCEKGVCLGTTCQSLEITPMKRHLNWLDPATATLIGLVCDPKKREAADTDGNGTVDPDEMEKVFQCDARKFPPTRIYREGQYDDPLYSAAALLAQYLLYDPESLSDTFAQARGRELRRLYPLEWLVENGITNRSRNTMSIVKLKAMMKVTKKDGWETVHFPPIPENVETRCFWGGSAGLEHSRPRVENFSLPVYPTHGP